MTDINEIISTNFNENIAYIQTYHKKLFDKLSALDNAVANGHYQEKYELIFEKDAFDVIELASNNRLYNAQSKKHTQLAKKSVNSRLDNSLFECFVRQEGKKPLPYVTPIIDKISHLQKENVQLREFGKFIFFGVGLGLHIEAIHTKIEAKNYLIVEDDLELFRLSLFCVNYKEIAKKANITFAIFEDDEIFSQLSEEFLTTHYHLNHYIKYFQLMSHSEHKYNRFHLSVTNQAHIRFLFHDLLDTYTRPLNYFAQGYKIIQKTLSFQDEKFTHKPFLLLTSGPSLQHNVEWLVKNQKYFTIVSASSSLYFLEQHHIVPDIVLHIDPFIASTTSIKKLDSIEFIKDALIVLNSGVHQDFLAKFNKENIYLVEMGSNHQESSFKLTGPCVGSAGLLFLILSSVQESYLLGLDLAIDSNTGSNHTSTHQNTKILSTKEDAFDNQMNYKDNVFEIEGNFQKKVLTTPHFYGSVEIINRYYPKLKKNFQKIYNLSDGAKYSIAQQKKPQDVELMQLKKLDKEHLKNIMEIHSNIFQQDDKEKLQTKLYKAQSIYDALKNYNYIPDEDTQIYINDILLLTHQEENKTDELIQVLDSYFRYILEYIYYCMIHLDDNLKKEELEHIFREQTLLFVKSYIISLQNTLNP